MADINKVWLSGVVINDPIMTKLGAKTPITTFKIQVNEQFLDKTGVLQTKANIILVESLGKTAETTYQKVKRGQRFTVDGYLRQDHYDGHESVRVRTFAVYPDESNDSARYREGIKHALEVLAKSRDLNSAREKLEELVR